MKILTAAVIAPLLLAACAATSQRPQTPAPTARLAAYLYGEFTADGADDEAAASLSVQPVYLERWSPRGDLWLLLHLQAADDPWAYRVYRLHGERNGDVTATIYQLPETLAAQGGVDMPLSSVESLTPSQLERLRGCEIRFRYLADRSFSGEIDDEDRCRYRRDDTQYVLNRQSIEPQRLTWWEQGFDKGGNAVWGPAAPGYRFRKLP